MKKLIVMVMLIFAGMAASAQDTLSLIRMNLGGIRLSNKSLAVDAFVNDDTTEVKYVAIQTSNCSHSKMDFDLETEFIIPYTVAYFKKIDSIKAKYHEWDEIARKNIVPDFMKCIDVYVPDIKGHLYNDKPENNNFFMNVDSMRFCFYNNYNQHGPCLRLRSWNNIYYKKTFTVRGFPIRKPIRYEERTCSANYLLSLEFRHPDEFDAFYDLIRPDKIWANIRKPTGLDLFK